MVLEQLAAFDKEIFLIIYSLRAAPLDQFFSLVTHLGSYFFLFAMGIILLTKNRKAGFSFIAGLIVNLAVILFLKQIILRPRPFETLEGIKILDEEASSSFPSGHSANAFFGAAFLSGIYKKFSFVLYALALVIAFSRIYVGVHYPIDVLVGSLIGFFVGKLFEKKFPSQAFLKKLNLSLDGQKQIPNRASE